jgi:large subunit ribosomal protein L4
VDLKTYSGTAVSLSDATFAREFNEGLVHQAVVAYQAGGRAGSKAQKTRSDVRGGGIKPFRQKGTGRARAGTIRSPIWRSGGVTFAARPRNYSQKMNRKQYRAAMQCILSELARQERLLLVDEFKAEEAKTSAMAAKLKDMSLDNVLIVTEDIDEKLYLSIRNIPYIGICDVEALDPASLVRFDKILMTVGAARKVEEWLG